MSATCKPRVYCDTISPGPTDSAPRDRGTAPVAFGDRAQYSQPVIRRPKDALRRSRFDPGDRVGPYVLGEVLASGGMGRVSVATDERSGIRVAIKTSLPGPAAQEAILGEISALSALEHPGVVKLLEHGRAGNQPWYAMPLLRGPTLRQVLVAQSEPSARGAAADQREVPTSTRSVIVRTPQDEAAAPQRGASTGHLRKPLDSGAPSSRVVAAEPAGTVDWTREAVFEVCIGVLEVLEYVHSRRVVHADIKPENVFLVDGQPVLVDFGVARAFDRPRDALDPTFRGVGSVAYMAPEQVIGEVADARADLYAMGCVLYECLAGYNPFLRDDVQGTLLAQLKFTPPPLCDLILSISIQHSRIVERLLMKRPDERPAYAADVLAVLAPHRVVPAWSRSSIGAAHLCRAELLGREAQITRFEQWMDEARRGQGTHVCLRGGAGCGKTRFLLEVCDLASADAVHIFRVDASGHADDSGLLRPFYALQGLLQALSSLVTRERIEAGSANAIDSALACAAGGTYRDLVGLAGAIHQTLLGVASNTTVLVAVDHVDGMDSSTLVFLRALARTALKQRRMLVVWADEEAQTLRPREPNELLLPPLTQAEVQRAIGAMLALERPSAQLVNAAYRVSEGNPYLLGQYLRSLIDERVLTRDRHRGWHVDAHQVGKLDSSSELLAARQLFSRRIATLSREQRALGAMAGMLGRTFRSSTLVTISGLSDDQVARAVAELVQANILDTYSSGRYRFTHDALRVALADDIAAEDAESLHRRAAEALSAESGADPAIAQDIALHLSCCSEHARASEAYELAADHALKAGQLMDAVTHFRSALQELRKQSSGESHDASERRIQEALGDVLVSSRSLDEAVRAYSRALDLSHGTLEHVRLLRKLAAAHDRDKSRALACLEQAITLLDTESVQSAEHRAESIQSHLDAMFIHYWRQETQTMLELGNTIGPLVELEGTALQRASYHFNLAAGLMQFRRYQTGQDELSHVEQALALYEQERLPQKVAMCRFLRSMVWLFSGQLERAEGGFRELLDLGERSASVTIQLRSLTYLCLLERKRRARERVRRLAASVLSLAQEHDMPEYEGVALANLAWLAWCDGELLECIRFAERAETAWRASPLNYAFCWTAHLPLLAALVSSKDPTNGVRCTELALGLLAESQERPPKSLLRAISHLRGQEPSLDRDWDDLQAVVTAAVACGWL